jgi:uncharacterized DUF497 family protein
LVRRLRPDAGLLGAPLFIGCTFNLVVVIWTPRGEVRRIISMRKANEREKSFYAQYLD